MAQSTGLDVKRVNLQIDQHKTEEDPRINNLRVANNRLKEHQLRRTSSRQAGNSTYTRAPNASKYQRGSLDNVANINVERNQQLEPLSLRRCRSLALTEEDVFNSLEIRYDDRPSRRPQLIPRARLVDRTPREQRYGSRVTSTEDLYNRPSRTTTDRKSNLEAPLPVGKSKRKKDIPSASLDAGRYPEENAYDSLEFLPEYQKIDEPPGLNLPNYYPDSRYESDNTDNVSTVDNISVSTVGYKKYQSCDNLSSQNFQEQPESISYDENIVLSKNRPLYGALQDTTCEKPRTIRSPTAITSEEYFSATICKSGKFEKTFVEESKAEESVEIKKQQVSTLSLIEKEGGIRKDVEETSLKDSSIGIYSTVEINPLYDINKNTTEDNQKTEGKTSADEKNHQVNGENNLATNINIEYANKESSDDFKTIVRVDSNTASISSTTDEETKVENKEKQHSHNYLREFLESQKGSKKPLQNFLIKKFPNLSRKNSKEKHTNLVDNNFYSLPDITVCKNLKKCDKIDRKLRNCEKVSKSGESEDRFIVNIGRHFDLTANSNIPVDFELKLAKVSKKKKNQIKLQKAEEFLQAVKDLNQTLEDNNHSKIDTKPEIIGIKTKTIETVEDNCKQSEIEVTMDLTQSELEYQDKLGNMRTYWNKLVGHNSEEEGSKSKDGSKCKIVDVQTKVEDVKKKFESDEEKHEIPFNKVQIAKQIFENKPTERIEKVSPLIKNTCSFFSQHSVLDKNNQYESLNPNIVEIIDKKNTQDKPQEKSNGTDNSEEQQQTTKKEKKHKPITKSLSITYPEFDYVRYRVVKSDLFQKRIFAKCDMESQFDGLMQYLQDYSFQELLIDNNIVIIEPIRTTIIREKANKYHKPVKNITPLLHKNNETGNQKNGLRKHFFYHPVRVNKEVNDNELPNPDTVKQVRQLFEKKEKCINNTNRRKIEYCKKNIDLDKDICSVDSTRSVSSENGINEYTSLDSFDEEPCCEQQYITEDVMEKIRKYGTTITYYGGRIVRKQCSQDSLTNVIMEEIKKNETKDFHCKYDTVGEKEKRYQGLKFKLVKSNSCSSRLELVGTQNLAKSRQKYFNKRQELIKEAEEKTNSDGQNRKLLDKNEINECIKKQASNQQVKLSDNKTYTKWGDKKQKQTIYGIQFNDKIIEKLPIKTKYEFHNFEQTENKTRVLEDMDFEPYEIA